MGYQTYFSGSVEIDPPLNEHEISFLKDFSTTRRMNRTKGPLFVGGSGEFGQGHDDDVLDHNNPHPDQPGLWCQWVADSDGTELEWDGNEKFYFAGEWMEYIVYNLLSSSAAPYVAAHLKEDERLKHFTCDHKINGEIYADGEEGDDYWRIVVEDSKVAIEDGYLEYGPRLSEAPTPEEVAGAIKSIGGGRLKVKVYSVTTDVNEVVTQVFSSEQEAYDSLKANFAAELDADVSTNEGRGELIYELTERQGVVLYIEEHEVEVTL